MTAESTTEICERTRLRWQIQHTRKRIVELEAVLAYRREAFTLMALSGDADGASVFQIGITINERQLRQLRDNLARDTSDLEKLKAP
jgi:hypothetical protein